MAGQITIVSGEDYEKNLDRIKEIVTRLPVETREWAMRAFRYESKKEFNNAANMCRRVLEFCPAEDAAELRMMLGRCNFALKKYFPAEIMFQNLIEEMPDEKLPKLYMGLILHEMEEYEKALTYLEGIWPVSFVHPDYVDAFGHKQLTGTAAYLAAFLGHEIGCKTRSVEFSTLQRSASHMASRVDIDEAFMVGGAAVKAADEGYNGNMVVIDRVSDDPYMASAGIYDVHRIANEEKLVPREWMNEEGNYVTKDFVDYVKPLIQGDYQPIMVNGLPRHLVLDLNK